MLISDLFPFKLLSSGHNFDFLRVSFEIRSTLNASIKQPNGINCSSKYSLLLFKKYEFLGQKCFFPLLEY